MRDKRAVMIKYCTDVRALRSMVIELYRLLDSIDTLDDACRGNDKNFRNFTRAMQKKRHDFISTDGYEIYVGGHLTFMDRHPYEKPEDK